MHEPLAQDLVVARRTVAGALRLVRMLPVLEQCHTPFLAETEAIATAQGHRPGDAPAWAVTAVRSWRAGREPTQDIAAPEYLQSLAAGIVLAVAGDGDPEDRRKKIDYSTGNFWDTCDHLVFQAGGHQLAVFRQLPTTLRGVEDQWQALDDQAMATDLPLAEVFAARHAKIQASLPRRREIAAAIASCAGW